MKKLGNKIAAPRSRCKCADRPCREVIKVLASFFLVSILFSGCVMTRAQGEVLTHQVRNLEDEVAKLQRLRHDMEILLIGQMDDVIDRIGSLERQLTTLRESLSAGALKNEDLLTEVKSLRGELEEAQNKYQRLERDQLSLAEKQIALKETGDKIQIPSSKDEHFSLGKKYYVGGRFEDAIYLLQKFIEKYPSDKELTGQSHYLLGEIYKKLGDGEKSKAAADKNYKRAVVEYQKIVDMYKRAVLREEALFKMGMALKAMGNVAGAKAAFNELIAKHGNGNRAASAKKQLAELEKKK